MRQGWVHTACSLFRFVLHTGWYCDRATHRAGLSRAHNILNENDIQQNDTNIFRALCNHFISQLNCNGHLETWDDDTKVTRMYVHTQKKNVAKPKPLELIKWNWKLAASCCIEFYQRSKTKWNANYRRGEKYHHFAVGWINSLKTLRRNGLIWIWCVLVPFSLVPKFKQSWFIQTS